MNASLPDLSDGSLLVPIVSLERITSDLFIGVDFFLEVRINFVWLIIESK